MNCFDLNTYDTNLKPCITYSKPAFYKIFDYHSCTVYIIICRQFLLQLYWELRNWMLEIHPTYTRFFNNICYTLNPIQKWYENSLSVCLNFYYCRLFIRKPNLVINFIIYKINIIVCINFSIWTLLFSLGKR